jgi:hypothetical protein
MPIHPLDTAIANKQTANVYSNFYTTGNDGLGFLKN